MISGAMIPSESEQQQYELQRKQDLINNRITILDTYESIWEEYPIEIHRDYELQECHSYDKRAPCKHIRDGKIPLVIVAANEGGFNSTGICLECAVEIYNKIQTREIELN